MASFSLLILLNIYMYVEIINKYNILIYLGCWFSMNSRLTSWQLTTNYRAAPWRDQFSIMLSYHRLNIPGFLMRYNLPSDFLILRLLLSSWPLYGHFHELELCCNVSIGNWHLTITYQYILACFGSIKFSHSGQRKTF